MSVNTGATLVLVTGGITFANEWMQTSKVNWRIPVATLFGAVAVDLIGKISPLAGTALGAMVLIAGLTAPLNGKTPIETFTAYLPQNRGKGTHGLS